MTTQIRSSNLVVLALASFLVGCASDGQEGTSGPSVAVETSTVPDTSAPATTTSAAPETTTPPTQEEPAEAIPVLTEPLEMRSCYTLSVGNSVTAIDCVELHDGQVFLTGQQLPSVDAAETDASVWVSAADDVCGSGLLTFTGSDGSEPSPDWDLAVLLETTSPTPKVSCAVVSTSGEQWAGTAESIQGTYLGITVGDCFNFPTPEANALEIPCTQPHEGEMFILDVPVLDSDQAAPYPTDAEWGDISSFICDAAFEKYTGVSVTDLTSDLSYTTLIPLEPDWFDIGSRLISCAVVSYDGTLLVGSRAT